MVQQQSCCLPMCSVSHMDVNVCVVYGACFFRLVYMYIKSHSSTFSNNTNGDWGIVTTKHSCTSASHTNKASWQCIHNKFGKIDASTTNPINSCLFSFSRLFVRVYVWVYILSWKIYEYSLVIFLSPAAILGFLMNILRRSVDQSCKMWTVIGIFIF